ncbi:hypothetical protein FGO68_gene9814 [Halteria grandinella]|uniref:Uncharacterized protein n=1 Tax=Halteria grandinella TaxID=5974 RepID=A0A8J8P1E8_HALGN|nr:hypothetical protein FGO68_gene9814 [Halteria grandinella]
MNQKARQRQEQSNLPSIKNFGESTLQVRAMPTSFHVKNIKPLKIPNQRVQVDEKSSTERYQIKEQEAPFFPSTHHEELPLPDIVEQLRSEISHRETYNQRITQTNREIPSEKVLMQPISHISFNQVTVIRGGERLP